MAVQIIAFPVVARQNTNDDSTAFGKWFLTPYWPETLNLRGLIERVAFSQSVYSRDIVEGVITKLTEVMVELLKSQRSLQGCQRHGIRQCRSDPGCHHQLHP